MLGFIILISLISTYTYIFKKSNCKTIPSQKINKINTMAVSLSPILKYLYDQVGLYIARAHPVHTSSDRQTKEGQYSYPGGRGL